MKKKSLGAVLCLKTDRVCVHCRNKNRPYPTDDSENSSIILFNETCFLTSIMVQWLYRMTLKARRCRRSHRGFEPLSPVVFHISPYSLLYTLFSEVLASVMILGRNSLLKFVWIVNSNNISKLQYSVDSECSLSKMSALAHQKCTLSDGWFREFKHNTVPWNLFFKSVIV